MKKRSNLIFKKGGSCSSSGAISMGSLNRAETEGSISKTYLLVNSRPGGATESHSFKSEHPIETGQGDCLHPLGCDQQNHMCRRRKIWDDTCGRQGSWYRTSNKNGLYLIISAFELDDFEIEKSAVITESDFVLPAPASPVVKQRPF